jgi:hypothetical protein
MSLTSEIAIEAKTRGWAQAGGAVVLDKEEDNCVFYTVNSRTYLG